MALVVLRSPAGSPAEFQNTFDDPLVVGGQTGFSHLQLVSAVLELPNFFIVETGFNDTCRFRIKKSGVIRTVTIPPGTYNISEMRATLEREFNNQVDVSGSSWHVSYSLDEAGHFDGWTILGEWGFTTTEVTFDYTGSTLASTPGDASSGLNVGNSGWGYSNQAISRGRGWYLGRVPDVSNDCIIGVLSQGVSLVDGSDSSSFYAGVRVDGSSRAPLTIRQGVETVNGWTLLNGDYFRVSKEYAALKIQASTDGTT